MLIYRRPRTHFIADFRVLGRGHLPRAHPGRGEGRRHHRGSRPLARGREGQLLDPVVGHLQVVRRVVGNARRRSSANRSTSVRCWPPSWPSRRTGRPSCPPAVEAIVTLAPQRGDLAPRAHPLGRFVFVQQVAAVRPGPGPVRRRRRGRAEPLRRRGGHDRWAGAHAVATLTGAQPVREHFARAQFVEMSEEERLTRPAYEALDAGVEFSSAGFDVSAQPVRAAMTFETRYLDLETGEIRTEARPATEGHGARPRAARRRSAATAPRAAPPQRVVEQTARGPASRSASPSRRSWPPTASRWTRSISAVRRPPRRCWSSSGCDGPAVAAQVVETLRAGDRARPWPTTPSCPGPAAGSPVERRPWRSTRRCPPRSSVDVGADADRDPRVAVRR